MGGDENDPEYKARVSAFTQALGDLGWTDGRNVRMDLRRAGGDINRIRALAAELVGLQSDIIVTDTTPATAAVQRETRTIPIVFASPTSGFYETESFNCNEIGRSLVTIGRYPSVNRAL